MVLGKGMSISVTNAGGVKGSGYVHGVSCISMIDSPEICNGDGIFSVENIMAAKEKKGELKVQAAPNTCSSSSTSSIGKNSDISGRSKENSGDTDEVQSSYKGPLDAMEALEEVLPIRRGISKFYNGKSKSFASLAYASSSTSSIKELAKPQNAYMRRRRNLLASNIILDNKNRSSPLKSNGGGVSKRVPNSNRYTLALAVTMSSSCDNSNNDSDYNLSHYPTAALSVGSPSSLLRTCLHSQLRDYQCNGSSLSSSPRQNFSAWRSLSLADLQECDSMSAACTASTTSELDIKPSHT